MLLNEWLEDKLGQDIWKKKYQHADETLEAWFDRVSGGDPELRTLIKDKKFLFAGRILANRGIPQSTGRKGTYSNCYVLPAPEDNLESIYKTCAELARTYSYGGGVGIDISKLRPEGAPVNNAAQTTTGAVSFMPTFSEVTATIGQKGRRGALMLSISSDHPDIEQFIDVKKDLQAVTKANISIRISDDFLLAVIHKRTHGCKFILEDGAVINKRVDASALFEKLCQNNWEMAEPGLLFWDEINRHNILSEYIKAGDFEYAGVNPCAEEPLPAGGSCLLGAINLAEFVDGGDLDVPKLQEAVRTAVFALNRVLDEGLLLHPLHVQQNSARDWRQIGLGIMGLGDLLIKMKLTYGTKEAVKFTKLLMEIFANAALQASAEWASAFGYFPEYDTRKVLNSTFIRKIATNVTKEMIQEYGLANSQVLTVAPTGSISTMLGVSGGIEPLFATSYQRKTESLHEEGDVYYTVTTPICEAAAKLEGCAEGEFPDYVITSHEIPWKQRIDMQAAVQRYIDASISSTVNLPEETTVETVKDLYLAAWEQNLKGITIYRNNCFRTGILTTDSKSKEEEIPVPVEESSILEESPRGFVRPSTDNCLGFKRRLMTGCGTLWVNAYFNTDNGELCDIFLSKGSTGGCNSFMVSQSRMISLAARGGVGIEDIIDQLQSSPVCASYKTRKSIKNDTSKGTSCPSAIAYSLHEIHQEFKRIYNVLQQDEKEVEPEVVTMEVPDKLKEMLAGKCPECQEPLNFSGGCNSCPSCGYTKCD